MAIEGELVPPIEGSRLTLSVENGRVWGSSGINRFMGRLGDDGLFGPLATTMMAGPDQLMAQEQTFLRHLDEAESWESADGGISLTSSGLISVTLVPLHLLSQESGLPRA